MPFLKLDLRLRAGSMQELVTFPRFEPENVAEVPRRSLEKVCTQPLEGSINPGSRALRNGALLQKGEVSA